MKAGKDTVSSRPGPFRRPRLFLQLALLAALLAVPVRAAAQTELGSEDDLTVLGRDGSSADPDAEIKGFTVFGATQAAYTGAVAGPGNVVVNGALAVSSGAYFVGDSTFPAAGKIYLGDGSSGQILSKGTDGALVWTSASAIGDNLGNHIATTTLNMAQFPIVNVSSITMVGDGIRIATSVYAGASGIFISRYGEVQTIGGNTRGAGAVDLQSDRSAATQVAGGQFATISGGYANTASGTYSTIGGGDYNVASGDRAAIGGGKNNSAGAEAFVGGGSYNVASGPDSAVTGGDWNTASGTEATVAGGVGNIASGGQSFAGGGDSVDVRGEYSGSVGGSYNVINGTASFIGGGNNNQAFNFYSAVLGGDFNWAYALESIVAGGNGNGTYGEASAVVGGVNNMTYGFGALALGGYGNNAAGDYSFAAGRASSSSAPGTFTWADSQSNTARTINNVQDRTVFKNRGGFLITGSTNTYMTGAKDRGVFVTGNGLVGISTGVPYAALDVVSSATASNVYAQIWRDGGGVIVASMTSQGKLYADISGATGIPSGDNLGDHTATNRLEMSNKAIDNVSSMTVTGAGVAGSDPLFKVAGSTLTVLNNGNVGVGVAAPTNKFEVQANATTFQVNPQAGYVSLMVNGVEVARMKP